MSYNYQHRFTFYNVANLKSVSTDWFDRDEATVDLAFELEDPDFEDWLQDRVGLTADQILDNVQYRLETRVPRYDDIEQVEAEQ
jgi:hypothetical protein